MSFLKLLSSFKKEFQKHRLHYLVLFILLSAAFFVRIYRTDMLLRFYYDQGRDALVIKKMIETPKPVLVGPTTGLEGIMRGPIFYYILLPGYLIGQGSPIVATIWLQLIYLIGLIFTYLSAREIFSKFAGLLVVFLIGFSNNLVSNYRWLSEPSLTFILVPVMLYGLLQIIKKKNTQIWWPTVALMLGLNLHAEIASGLWFVPALFLFFLLYKKIRPTLKEFIISSGVFLSTLLPQVIFDFRHDHIMWKAFRKHFTESNQSSFLFDKLKIIERFNLFVDTFSNILVERQHWLIYLLLFITPLLYFLSKKFRQPQKILLLFLLFIPLVVLTFYQGNSGNFYSYYLITLYPIFIILVAGVLSYLVKKPPLFVIPLVFLFIFVKSNFILVKNFLIAGVDGPEHVSLGNQIQAIDWIYQQAGDIPFNVDAYVPPVIPHSYDYLVPWYGQKNYGKTPVKERVDLLFTLNEIDTQHPQFLEDWFERQAGIGEVLDKVQYGGVRVQKRKRIIYED